MHSMFHLRLQNMQSLRRNMNKTMIHKSLIQGIYILGTKMTEERLQNRWSSTAKVRSRIIPRHSRSGRGDPRRPFLLRKAKCIQLLGASNPHFPSDLTTLLTSYQASGPWLDSGMLLTFKQRSPLYITIRRVLRSRCGQRTILAFLERLPAPCAASLR